MRMDRGLLSWPSIPESMPMSHSQSTPEPTAPAGLPTLEQRLEGLPPDLAELLRAVRAALEQRRADEAAQWLEQARTRAEPHPEFLRLFGITRHLQERPQEAVALLRRALDASPGDAMVLTNLGSALRAAGERDAAMVALVRACELAPEFAAAWYNLGRAHGAERRPEEARAAFRRALDCEPGHSAARLAHADASRTLGHIEEATEGYRSALRDGAGIEAWARLAALKTVRFEAAETAELERLFAAPATAAGTRARIGFVLARALEDAGRMSEAYAVLGIANAIKRHDAAWDARRFSASIDAIMQAFPAPLVTASPSSLGHEVVFIVSMPRSGSTLVEQILASHPEVEGANELSDLSVVMDGESRRTGTEFPAWVAHATPDDWRRLGEEYLERTARWRQRRSRFTDKALSNWGYMGAVAAMLPAARFVDCRRDPLETCLSCWRQLFVRGQHFSYDIADLAAYWHDYERLMRFWQSRYPGLSRIQSHERLVDTPEAEVRALLEFCGLSFDPACLDFHRTQRAVHTMSAAQVREPLRTDTARAWRYGELLLPMRLALGIA